VAEHSATEKPSSGTYVSKVVQPRSLHTEDISGYQLLVLYRYALQEGLKSVVCILREAIVWHINQGLPDVIVD
jgi:hypothetical protein